MEILNKIQRTLKVPKSQQNTFGNYRYRSCEDILEAVKPLLDGATLTISDEIVLVGDRHYVRATATLSDGEKSVSVSAFARESLEKKGMDSAQITGSASSYARKYALNGLFAIDDTKDDDDGNAASAPRRAYTPNTTKTTPTPSTGAPKGTSEVQVSDAELEAAFADAASGSAEVSVEETTVNAEPPRGTITDAQMRMLHALTVKLGATTTEEKLAVILQHTGIVVEHVSALSKAKASAILAALKVKADALPREVSF